MAQQPSEDTTEEARVVAQDRVLLLIHAVDDLRRSNEHSFERLVELLTFLTKPTGHMPEDRTGLSPRWHRMDETHPAGFYLFGSDPDQEEVPRHGFGAAAPIVPAWGFGPSPAKPPDAYEAPAEGAGG